MPTRHPDENRGGIQFFRESLDTGFRRCDVTATPAWRMFYAAMLAFVTFALVACSSAPSARLISPSELPQYRIVVEPAQTPEVSADGYKLLLRFSLRSQGPFPYGHLIQEIRQTATYISRDGTSTRHDVTLVEAFRLASEPTVAGGEWVYSLEPFQRDKHFESGFASTPHSVERTFVRRDVRLYSGVVEGADFTLLGFAHLPKNREGSMSTDIPSNFNRTYQDDHDIRGRVLIDDRAGGSHRYNLEYEWRREDSGRMSATLTFDPDASAEGDSVVTVCPAPMAAASGGGGDR